MNEKITLIDKDNKEIECDVVLAYEDKDTKKGYLVYTDGTLDENGEKNMYASYYNPLDPDDVELKEIETQEEVDMLMSMLEKMGGNS